MRIILTIMLVVVAINAQAGVKKQRELKKEVQNCENALKACLSAKDVLTDTIFVYTGKEAVKVAKQSEKTKRELSKQLTNQIKSNNKTEVKTDDTRLWTKTIIKVFRNSAIIIILLFGGRLSKKFIGSSWII